MKAKTPQITIKDMLFYRNPSFLICISKLMKIVPSKNTQDTIN